MEEETNIKVYIHYLPPGKMQGKSMNTGCPFHKEFFRKSGIMVIQESVLIIIFAPLLALSTPQLNLLIFGCLYIQHSPYLKLNHSSDLCSIFYFTNTVFLFLAILSSSDIKQVTNTFASPLFALLLKVKQYYEAYQERILKQFGASYTNLGKKMRAMF